MAGILREAHPPGDGHNRPLAVFRGERESTRFFGAGQRIITRTLTSEIGRLVQGGWRALRLHRLVLVLRAGDGAG